METNPSLINEHCICDWLALASKDAFRGDPLLEKVQGDLDIPVQVLSQQQCPPSARGVFQK